MKAVSIDRKKFIPYPTNRVVGTIADAAKAGAAIDALLQAGIARDDIDVLHGEEDLHRLDSTGVEHGFLAQFQRSLIRTLDLEEFRQLTHYVEDVRAGLFVVMVLAKRRALRVAAADILHRYGAPYVEFYGRWSCEDLPSTAQTSPEDIPALFARAWNARDPDALASLFDEDAEFVNVDGLCWHGRPSIREAHASRFKGVVTASTVVTGETKVKLLSPEFAVVHSRMTMSDEECAPGATQSGARSTIVSFVVHRAGERWRCAAAQNTDVVQNAASVPQESVRFGAVNQPTDQVS